MAGQNTRFYVDKRRGKFLGVCAGIADYWGADVTLIRVGAVLSPFIIGPLVLLAYFIIAWMAPNRPRELDRRLADVEAYVTSPDRRLAREIDSLR